jgi:hypothetical protein
MDTYLFSSLCLNSTLSSSDDIVLFATAVREPGLRDEKTLAPKLRNSTILF